MKSYMYANTYTPQLEASVVGTEAEPLIEELFYKYGLKLYSTMSLKKLFVAKYRYSTDNVTENTMGYLLTLDGLCYCIAYAIVQTTGITYCVMFNKDVKERGTYSNDRSTIQSNKISALMKSIEKRKAMPDMAFDKWVIDGSSDQLLNHIKGNTYKSSRLNGEDIHMLLDLTFGNRKLDSLKTDSRESLLKLLVEYQEVDKTKQSKQHKLDEFYGKELYMIGSDMSDGYVIGKIKADVIFEKANENKFETTQPFQRILDMNDYEEKDKIIPVLTMLKLAKEGEDIKIRNNYFYQNSMFYDEDMKVNVWNYNIDAFNCQWIMIPTEDI